MVAVQVMWVYKHLLADGTVKVRAYLFFVDPETVQFLDDRLRLGWGWLVLCSSSRWHLNFKYY
jgi:hypothetical protein